jgi:DNA-binding ferritin-like protein
MGLTGLYFCLPEIYSVGGYAPPFFCYSVQMNEEMSEFVATLLHSSTVTHFMHWSTDSFAKHSALGEYYSGIIELVDQLAEAYMGKYQQLKKFPEEFHTAKDPIKYLESMKEFVGDARKELPKDSELQNLIDEIADLINSTLYKLRFLN